MFAVNLFAYIFSTGTIISAVFVPILQFQACNTKLQQKKAFFSAFRLTGLSQGQQTVMGG